MADSKLRDLSTDFAVKVIKMCDGREFLLPYPFFFKISFSRDDNT